MNLINIALNKLVTTDNVIFNTYTPDKIVNGNLDSTDGFLCKDNGVFVLLKIILDNPHLIKKVKLKQLNYNNIRRCKEFTIKASNDNINYNAILSETLLNNDNLQEFILNVNKPYKYWCILIKNNYSGETGWSNGIGEFQLYANVSKYLINQNKNYYSTKSNFLNLGQPKNNTQLENWYHKYGANDINIITENLNNKEFPMSKNENGIWETDFDIDINEVKDNIGLVDTDENNKSIKYNCNDYRILDLCDDEFDIRMLREK
ncbi:MULTISPECIES: cell adhesion protein [Clostridium]|uniref:cell adhesion protein n=1 Tax=Clostridium TaxID=1485 RepID=UPI00090A6C21|nr:MULTISPECIES: cell adhesion protein [Clostridium]APF27182.1 hypothetical protein NPD7_53 [Clostridium sporogenes]MDI6918830.1 cell adhesion protein [Clostridium botulinum]WMU97071.1 cell adhesion protein [Clostridium botulinum]